MTRSSILLCLVAALLAGTGISRAQEKLPTEDTPLGPTVTWLRNVITKSGGFSYGKTTTTVDAQSGSKSLGPVRERLGYAIHEVQPCHLGWGENVSGDEEMQMLHPQIGLDQDLGVVEPRSASVVSLNLATAEGAGASDLGAGGSIQIAVLPDAKSYWKVTARWAFVHNDGDDEPFGFIFADEQIADQVAQALDHTIDLCSGPRNFVGDQCMAHNEKIERQVAVMPAVGQDNRAARVRFSFDEAEATYINHGDTAMTCVIREWAALHLNDPVDLKYFDAHAFELGSPTVFTLKPGEHFAPVRDAPNAPRAQGYDVRIEQRCYQEHSVDNVGNQCADLHLRGDH